MLSTFSTRLIIMLCLLNTALSVIASGHNKHSHRLDFGSDDDSSSSHEYHDDHNVSALSMHKNLGLNDEEAQIMTNALDLSNADTAGSHEILEYITQLNTIQHSYPTNQLVFNATFAYMRFLRNRLPERERAASYQASSASDLAKTTANR